MPRTSREEYNKYMRDYMRERRRKAKLESSVPKEWKCPKVLEFMEEKVEG